VKNEREKEEAVNIKNINPNPQTVTPKIGMSLPAGLPEEYITKDEVARRLKKTARTIENWQRKGFIPFMKVGTSVIYRWSDIEAHMHRNFRVCRLTRRNVQSRNGATKISTKVST